MTKLRTRLALLLKEMGTWRSGSTPDVTARDLAERYDLDLDFVLILARSKGFRLVDEVQPDWVDPDADTKPIFFRRDVSGQEE